MFSTAFVLCVLRLFKLKTQGQTIYRKPHCKVSTQIQIFAYPWLAKSEYNYIIFACSKMYILTCISCDQVVIYPCALANNCMLSLLFCSPM